MLQWEGFDKSIEGLDLSESISKFFERLKKFEADDDVFLSGMSYLAKRGRCVMAALIGLEIVVLMNERDGYEGMSKISLINAFSQIQDFTEFLNPADKAELNSYLDGLQKTYPKTFFCINNMVGSS